MMSESLGLSIAMRFKGLNKVLISRLIDDKFNREQKTN